MDEQYRKRVDERAMELIRSGEYDHLVIPDRGASDRGLSYSIRDIPTFDGNGDYLPHIHMLEFSDFLDNTGSEFRDLPQEPQAEDREYHMTVIKDVVSCHTGNNYSVIHHQQISYQNHLNSISS